MRSPKMTVVTVCIWLARLPPGVGAYFNFVGASERLSRTGIARRKRTSDVHGLEWKAYMTCWSGFPLQGVHRFESLRLSDMITLLFVAVIMQII
jgi:hypothetical protein